MKKHERIQKISDAEWKAMHVLWKLGRASSNEIVAVLVPETQWSPNTIRTLLKRLAEKGVLEVEKHKDETGHSVLLYTAKYSREECAKVHSQTFLEKVFQGDAAELLTHFVQDTELSTEQLSTLRAMLDQIDGTK